MTRRLALLLVPLLLVGCGGSSDGGGGTGSGEGGGNGEKKSYRIAVIPKGTSHDFWLSVQYGAEKAAKELSVDGRTIEIEWQGTDDETKKAEQIQLVDTFIGAGIDGICLAPIDSEALVPPVERADGRGIPVVVFDSGLQDDSTIVSYVATDNEKGGELAGNHLAKVVGKGGDVILLRYQAGSQSTEQREDHFMQAIANPEYDIRILSENQRVNSDASEALKISESLLREHTEVDGVFTVCEPNNKGMLQALENEGKAGKVKFVAFDSGPRMIEGLKNGSVHGVVLQDPVNMGYLAVKTMVAHLDGETVEKKIDTGVHLATPENMEDEKIASLLTPKRAGHDEVE